MSGFDSLSHADKPDQQRLQTQPLHLIGSEYPTEGYSREGLKPEPDFLDASLMKALNQHAMDGMCRHRKKCDNVRPVCSQCRKAGAECAQSKSQTSNDSIIVPRRYLDSLEEKVSELEKYGIGGIQNQFLKSLGSSPPLMTGVPRPDSPQHSLCFTINTPGLGQNGRPGFGKPIQCEECISGAFPTQFPSDLNMTLLEDVSRPAKTSTIQHTTALPGPYCISDYWHLELYANVYLAHIHKIYPFLDEDSARRWIMRICQGCLPIVGESIVLLRRYRSRRGTREEPQGTVSLSLPSITTEVEDQNPQVKRDTIMCCYNLNEIISFAWDPPQSAKLSSMDDNVFISTGNVGPQSLDVPSPLEHLFQLRRLQAKIRFFHESTRKLCFDRPFKAKWRDDLKADSDEWKQNTMSTLADQELLLAVYRPNCIHKVYSYTMCLLFQDISAFAGVDSFLTMLVAAAPACRKFKLMREKEGVLWLFNWTAVSTEASLIFVVALTDDFCARFSTNFVRGYHFFTVFGHLQTINALSISHHQK
ncbi:hypothetical protein PV08_09598 [Exophiala spinifera]|uniref:Zn(2)-C6 fungal-type domain-containing protein n=1 Tax=Exophiala spinifera TaxID=91928 RepID=A0A0D1YBK5_9EURO|nr:uncharacterized protein PV08_09598 [Exophiala spinifera]KIW12321.1 hypothetical protein PV08_09598 [Exophiala spinifera]